MNRRRFILKSLGATFALPSLPSLMAVAAGGNSALQTDKGAGAGARRFVAVGNLLGYQTKHFFPHHPAPVTRGLRCLPRSRPTVRS